MIISYLISLIYGDLTLYDFAKYLFFSVLAVLICMTVHEFCHSLTAYAFGDRTSKDQGRLSLNPFAHLDVRGLLFLLLFGFGYAKPVMVRQSRMKHPMAGMICTAAAGPASNFLLSLCVMPLYLYCYIQAGQNPGVALYENLLIFTEILMWYSTCLGVFNLIPFPPLDGSKILGELLPLKTRMKYYALERYNLIFIVVFISLNSRLNITGFFADLVINTIFNIWLPAFI